MATIEQKPKVSCDNCNFTVEKEAYTDGISGHPVKYLRPANWGGCKIESYQKDMYGAKDRMDFTDLCPNCAKALVDVGAAVLKARRGEVLNDYDVKTLEGILHDDVKLKEPR